MRECQCVFPSESEQEMVTLPGNEPGTALRVYLQGGAGGYVRLQQLAHDAGLGWYVQKSMVIHRDLLELLIPQLRKGLCLMPKLQKWEPGGPIKLPQISRPGDDSDSISRAG